MVKIQLFGKMQIRSVDGSVIAVPKKPLELMAYLLLQPQQQSSREQLACILWGDISAATAKKYLRNCLWQLQNTMFSQYGTNGRQLISTEQDWIALRVTSTTWVDIHLFETIYGQTSRVPAHQLTFAEYEAIKSAVAIYEGELLGGWYQDWCLIARERFQVMYFALLEKLMDYCLIEMLYDEGCEYGLTLLGFEPSRESTHHRLMQLYLHSGNRSAALRQFDQCSSALRFELGVGPSEQTISLYEYIRGSASLPLISSSQIEGNLRHVPDTLLAKLLSELANLKTCISTMHDEMADLKAAVKEQVTHDAAHTRRGRKPYLSRQRKISH